MKCLKLTLPMATLMALTGVAQAASIRSQLLGIAPPLIIFAGAAVWASFRVYRLKRRTAVAQFWSRTEAEVTAASVLPLESQRYSTRYLPRVAYRFTVGGIVHTGTRLTLGNDSVTSAEAAAMALERYRVGARVAVHYDPQNPQENALELTADAGSVTGTWIMLGACGLFLAFATISFLR